MDESPRKLISGLLRLSSKSREADSASVSSSNGSFPLASFASSKSRSVHVAQGDKKSSTASSSSDSSASVPSSTSTRTHNIHRDANILTADASTQLMKLIEAQERHMRSLREGSRELLRSKQMQIDALEAKLQRPPDVVAAQSLPMTADVPRMPESETSPWLHCGWLSVTVLVMLVLWISAVSALGSLFFKQASPAKPDGYQAFWYFSIEALACVCPETVRYGHISRQVDVESELFLTPPLSPLLSLFHHGNMDTTVSQAMGNQNSQGRGNFEIVKQRGWTLSGAMGGARRFSCQVLSPALWNPYQLNKWSILKKSIWVGGIAWMDCHLFRFLFPNHWLGQIFVVVIWAALGGYSCLHFNRLAFSVCLANTLLGGLALVAPYSVARWKFPAYSISFSVH
eukprot:gb/GEZN01006629.1/.p1 GENE.gb/GEZN01006629.1/~~gb/GEZN01006629.1/.p1  ORF type:complete len:399 (-),score=18.86 gb/GEZN01006629.1/:273-1469(-)